MIVSGLNPTIIGGFTGFCALTGVAATFVSTKMVERLGILKVSFLMANLLTLVSLRRSFVLLIYAHFADLY